MYTNFHVQNLHHGNPYLQGALWTRRLFWIVDIITAAGRLERVLLLFDDFDPAAVLLLQRYHQGKGQLHHLRTGNVLVGVSAVRVRQVPQLLDQADGIRDPETRQHVATAARGSIATGNAKDHDSGSRCAQGCKDRPKKSREFRPKLQPRPIASKPLPIAELVRRYQLIRQVVGHIHYAVSVVAAFGLIPAAVEEVGDLRFVSAVADRLRGLDAANIQASGIGELLPNPPQPFNTLEPSPPLKDLPPSL